MPIYEYQCAACEHQLESLQKMNEEPLRDCPQCGRPELRRLISQSSFRLKGSGWYATDFRDPKPAPGGEKDQDPAQAKEKGKEKGEEKGKDAAKPAESAKSDSVAPSAKSGGSPASGSTAKDTARQGKGKSAKGESSN